MTQGSSRPQLLYFVVDRQHSRRQRLLNSIRPSEAEEQEPSSLAVDQVEATGSLEVELDIQVVELDTLVGLVVPSLAEQVALEAFQLVEG